MARTVSEWIGKSDDHRAPGSVRDRILKREPCCHLCSLPIDGTKKWDLDHVVALINGGENRESNLRPAHRKCHVEKTARDVAEKAKVAAVRKKHNGSVRPAGKLKGHPFPTTGKAEKRVQRQSLPPRQLFREVTT
jgi:5-methylcytosine-specific restriction protein A